MSSEGTKAVDRAAQILSVFSAGDDSLGITELAREVGLPKSVVHRCVQSLTDYGLLSQDQDSRRYSLGPTTVQLGLRALGKTDVLAKAEPIMRELILTTQETATLTLRVGNERMYVAQVEGPQVVRMKAELGLRHPLYVGASGKAILSFLPDEELQGYLEGVELERLTPATIVDSTALRRELLKIRRQGYATSFGERDQWAASVAAPIRGANRQIVGSLAICGPLARFTPPAIRKLAPLVIAAAAEISTP